MFEYYSIKNNYSKIHAIIWKLIFSSNFKHFGKSSKIYFPLKIKNSMYIEIGNYVYIHNKACLYAGKIDENIPRLVIGDFTTIGHFSNIVAVRHVEIGQNVIIADRVYISDNFHTYENISIPIKKQPLLFRGDVYIGDNSWIGQNVCILGSSVGKHCVIGSNSVVTKEIPDYSVAVGAPAKVIKKYNFDNNKWERVD